MKPASSFVNCSNQPWTGTTVDGGYAQVNSRTMQSGNHPRVMMVDAQERKEWPCMGTSHGASV
jgi:hypothetical protein